MKNPALPAHVPFPRRTVLDLPAWGLGAVTLAGFGGSWHWLLDLTSHFRWYYLLAALVWYAVTSRRRSRLATAWLAIAVGANGWAMLPYWLPSGMEPGSGDRITIVSINLHCENSDTGPALAYLRDRHPDVVVCLEVDPAWATALRELDALYPYRMIEPAEGLFGIAVLSHVPLDGAKVIETVGGSPMIVTGLALGTRGCVLMAAHPVAPVSGAWSARRDAQMATMGELAAAERRPVVIAGDLNATPWSHGFRLLVGPRRLRDSALGRGIQSTWNARLWAPRIPIDHVIVSPDIAVASRTVGPDVGSDHLPVEAALVVP